MAAERVDVATDLRSPGYLFLADTFDPGWSATVDGYLTPIRPAQVAFRAVFLPDERRPMGFYRDELEALQRQLLVATTRARDYLWIGALEESDE